MKYFIYARKSTDEEDRQVLSIESQINELKEFAAKEKLEIAASLCEANTAKEPGRIIFNEMLLRIENGEADGILAWHPDRLARNPIDGGKVIYLVDTNKIKSLKFPSFWFDNTPQGKFMLNIAFGQSKYYIDNLSENVKRGIRQKLRRGEWPGPAPVGYLNDLKNKTIILNSNKYKFIQKLFKMYSTGDYSLKYLADNFNELGFTSRNGNNLSASIIQRILSNPFYHGAFKLNGELYQATHEPIITKKLFDKCQDVMNSRGRTHTNKTHNYIFTGLMKCGVCGCSITAEKQKGHIYYRCTKKKGNCNTKYTREESLTELLQNTLLKHCLPDNWIPKMLAKLKQDEAQSKEDTKQAISSLESQITALESKLDSLLELKLEDSISKNEYLNKKELLLKQKLDLEEKLKEINNRGNNWLEPMRDFILLNKQTKKIAKQGNLQQIRQSLKNIGSNFILKDNSLLLAAHLGWDVAAQSAAHIGWLGDRESNPDCLDQNQVSYH